MSKNTKTSKTAKAVGALLLAGALTAGVCCMGYASRGDNGKWFRNGNLSTWHWSDNKMSDSAVDLIAGNMLMGDNEINGLSLQAYALSAEEYEANAVPEEAETAVKIKVRFSPENTTDKRLQASLSFKNAQSTWASGKTVTDYVTASVNQQEILLTCTEAFGSQIELRIDTNHENIYATVSVDYIARPESVTNVGCDLYKTKFQGFNQNGKPQWLPESVIGCAKFTPNGEDYFLNINMSYGVGTITPKLRIDQYDITFDNQLLLDTNMREPCQLKSATSDKMTDLPPLGGPDRARIFRLDRAMLFEIIQRSTSFSEEAVLEGLSKQGVNNGYPYLIVKADYTIYYGDKIIWSGEKNARYSVDFTPLFVPADSITPDDDHIIL